MILPKLPNLLFWMFQTSLHKQTNKQASKQTSKQHQRHPRLFCQPRQTRRRLVEREGFPDQIPDLQMMNTRRIETINQDTSSSQNPKVLIPFFTIFAIWVGVPSSQMMLIFTVYIYLYSNIKGRTSTTIPKLESSTKEGATGQPRTSGVSWNSSPSPTPLSAATAQKKLRRIPGTLLISTALWRVVMNLFLLFEMPMLGDRQCLLYSVANHDIIIFAAAVSGSHPLTFS